MVPKLPATESPLQSDPVVNDTLDMNICTDSEDIPTIKSTSPPQEYHPSGLPKRNIRLPKCFQDILPAPPPTVITLEADHHSPSQSQSPSLSPPHDLTLEYKSEPNSFGIYRVYSSEPPSFTPDDNFEIINVSDSPNFTNSIQDSGATWGSPFGVNPADSASLISIAKHLFTNISVLRLMSWFYDGVTKTADSLNKLVYEVLLAPDFKLDDLDGFDASKEARKLDNFAPLQDGWNKTSLTIPLPCY
ncbi:hypothetical protein BDQ17DRAFT_1428189 [Cyathus striatus]|nr:hypothetical protein BDQ17DRAFT_1428189 [Cyathus striatus]